MSVSNSDNFTLTRDEIIEHTLMSLGVVRPGGTVPSADNIFCARWLNLIVKEWAKIGVHMWSKVQGTLFLRAGVNTYNISGTGSDQAGDYVVETTLSSSASGTTLTVVSTTGMSALDNIGIELDNGTRQWTTIVSVDSSTQVTINTSLTSSASSSNTVFSYTTHSSKPLNISAAVCRTRSLTDTPVYIKNEDEYLKIPNKLDTSTSINQFFYSSKRSDGIISVWPTPDSCGTRIKYNYNRILYDFDASSDNADFPVEWLSTLILALKAKVAEAYGKSTQERQMLDVEAANSLQGMQLSDIDGGSVRVVPAYRDDD